MLRVDEHIIPGEIQSGKAVEILVDGKRSKQKGQTNFSRFADKWNYC